MSMKPGLQLQIGQQLTMTPQLQQAIRLLQLSTVELRQEIQEALESNPLLELEEERGEDTAQADNSDSELDLEREQLPDELSVDSDWGDVYEDSTPSGPPPADGDDWEQNRAAPQTLADHLLWQLNLTPMSGLDQAIAYAIIEGLDDHGYLRVSLEDIASSARASLELAEDNPFPQEDEVLAVLHRVQQFDPPGVAARDLSECLTLQLRQLPPEQPWRDQAMQLVAEGLSALEKRDYAGLRRLLGATEPELVEIIGLIRSLNPNPGDSMAQSDSDYVIPDVIVSHRGGHWQVELNPDALPKLGINSYYAGLAGAARNEEEGSYLRGRLQEARWFLKSLQSRNDTLLRVSRRIVEVQKDFFDYGEEAMKPLVLADIAEAVEMHESTISRVTNQKYMLTPRGLYELKFFFSSHVGTEGGGECSSTAIRAIIKKLVAAEDPRKPLSDSKLASLLGEQGIQVARRTIAKYREAMRIPASSERRRLI